MLLWEPELQQRHFDRQITSPVQNRKETVNLFACYHTMNICLHKWQSTCACLLEMMDCRPLPGWHKLNTRAICNQVTPSCFKDETVQLCWELMFMVLRSSNPQDPKPQWDKETSAEVLGCPFQTRWSCGKGYESLSILMWAKIFSAGPSLMFMVLMRWSSLRSIKAWPSISWERNSSAISWQPGAKEKLLVTFDSFATQKSKRKWFSYLAESRWIHKHPRRSTWWGRWPRSAAWGEGDLYCERNFPCSEAFGFQSLSWTVGKWALRSWTCLSTGWNHRDMDERSVGTTKMLLPRLFEPLGSMREQVIQLI